MGRAGSWQCGRDATVHAAGNSGCFDRKSSGDGQIHISPDEVHPTSHSSTDGDVRRRSRPALITCQRLIGLLRCRDVVFMVEKVRSVPSRVEGESAGEQPRASEVRDLRGGER